jgi:tellurite resistance protein TerC
MQTDLSLWIGFNVFVLSMLALDLGVFNRKAHEISIKEALIWTEVWIMLAMCFSIIIYYWHGEVKIVEFLAGYVIEKALSVDNIFVFVLIFSISKRQRFTSIKFCFTLLSLI